MRTLLQAVVACLLASLSALGPAHEVRPGYLELRQADAEVWRVLRKVPSARRDASLDPPELSFELQH